MRTIKYRMWDKVEKEMIEWSELRKLHASLSYIEESERLDARILMQYTGLKDKNGKEIYEGDIVRGVFRKGVIGKADITLGEIRFYAPSFYICPHNESKFIMPFNDNILVEKNTCYEIIGNIYENPELLK